MASSVLPYFEALKLLKAWSTILLTLQAVLFIFLACACLFMKNEKLRPMERWMTASILFSALSIVIALNVIGTIPWSVQSLPDFATKYHNIYQFPNYIGIPIWTLAFGQHIFFIFAMFCLMVFLYKFTRSS